MHTDKQHPMTNRQTDINDCGLVCLQYILRIQGIAIPLHVLKLHHPWKLNFYTFQQLADIAAYYGVKGVGYYLDDHALQTLPLPVIIHVCRWRVLPHFLVLLQVGQADVSIMEPAGGKIKKISLRYFHSIWTRRALAFASPHATPHIQETHLNIIRKVLVNHRVLIVYTTILLMIVLLYDRIV